MDLFLLIGASFIVTGLIFFIFHNAIKTANYKRRSICFLILGLCLMIAIALGIYKDFRDGKLLKVTFTYIVFPLSVVIMTIIFTVSNLVNAKRYHHSLHKFKNLTNSSRQEYLYVVYKFKDDYLLTHESNYQGLLYKFDHNVYFHDEMINKVITKNAIDVENKRFCGTVSKKLKKKQIVYYCYEITINVINEFLAKYERVNKFDIPKLDIDPFHKNIIFRILINEQFKIDE